MCVCVGGGAHSPVSADRWADRGGGGAEGPRRYAGIKL